MNRLTRIVAVGVTTPLLPLPAATPAGASETYMIKSVSSSWPSSYTASGSATGVSVRWVATGDKMYVKDTAADGRRSGAWFFITGSGAIDGICYNTLGSGKTGLCDLELTEGRTLTVFPVTCDADTAASKCATGDVLSDDWKLGTPFTTHT